MISKLAKSVAYFFVEKNIIKKEDEEVYAYGMELLYSSILNVVLATVIALITNTILPTVIFFVTFVCLRQYIGGYHAKTHWGCLSILGVVLIVFSMLVRYVPKENAKVIIVVSVMISVTLVLLFAPVEHPNKLLSGDDKTRLRKKGVVFVAIVTSVIFVLCLYNWAIEYALYISSGMVTASVAMFCEVIKHNVTGWE